MQPQDESSVEPRIDPLAQHKHLPAVLNHLERQLGFALTLVHNPLKTRLIDQKASSGHQPTCTCVLCSSARDYGIVSTPRITFLAMPSKLIVLAARATAKTSNWLNALRRKPGPWATRLMCWISPQWSYRCSPHVLRRREHPTPYQRSSSS